MSRWKKISLALALVAVGVLAFLTWYKIHYSMEIAESFEVAAPDPEYQLLIATQGSDFKKAVVTGVIEALQGRPVSIRVIDVSGLSSIDVREWSAILLLHTWESREPQPNARLFLDRHPDRNKMIVLTTSGEGDLKMDGVDALTSASKKSDVTAHVNEITRRIDALLNRREK